jgi:hypothetical protein
MVPLGPGRILLCVRSSKYWGLFDNLFESKCVVGSFLLFLPCCYFFLACLKLAFLGRWGTLITNTSTMATKMSSASSDNDEDEDEDNEDGDSIPY